MTNITHTLVGATIGGLIINFNPDLSPLATQAVFVGSIISANLPDINVIWQHDLRKHHNDITHYPIPMLGTALLVMSIEFLLSGTTIIGQILFFNLLAHFTMDSFGHAVGMFPLMPFSQKEFSISKLRRDKFTGSFKSGVKRILSMQATYAELAVFSVATVLLTVI